MGKEHSEDQASLLRCDLEEGGNDNAISTPKSDLQKALAKEQLSDGEIAMKEAKGFAMAFWFAMLAIVSVGMTIGNKFVMLHYKYPNFVTLLQNCTAVACLVIGKVSGFVEIKPLALHQWKIFMFAAVFLTVQIVSSLMALPLVAIATTIVFRSISTCVVALLDWAIFGKVFSAGTVAALVMTSVGMLVYAWNDVNYNFYGYMWLMVNASATVANTFWNKIYISSFTKKKEQTTEGISLIQQTETVPLILGLMAYNQEWEAIPKLATLAPIDMFVLAGTCLGGYLISITYTKVYSLASGTSVILASTVNKAISIIGAYFVFHTFLLPVQIVGLCICIFGGLWYAFESKKKPNESSGFSCGEFFNFWKNT